MIDIEKVNKEFLKYVENYDLSDNNIERKRAHSMRVQSISKKIAENLNLSDEEINIAMVIGVLHDIGRFDQFKRYHTFNDAQSIDHGDFGVEILGNSLRNYILIDKYDDIILKAIKNHNKLKIEDSLNEKELLFTKIIRDADKIDIMYEAIKIFFIGEEEKVNNSTISDYSYNSIKNHQMVVISKDRKRTYLDKVMKYIGFVFDINFDISYKIIKENDYINKIIERFTYKDEKTKNQMEEIRKIVNEFLEEK